MKLIIEVEGETLGEIGRKLAELGVSHQAREQTAASAASAGTSAAPQPVPTSISTKKKATKAEERLVEEGKSVMPVCETHEGTLDKTKFTAARVDARHCTPCQNAPTNGTGKAHPPLADAQAMVKAFVASCNQKGDKTGVEQVLKVLGTFDGALGLAPSDRCAVDKALKPEHRHEFMSKLAALSEPTKVATEPDLESIL